MDYRKFYQKKLNVKINNDFEIHHIDFNRENNEINNLILVCDRHHKMAHSKVIDRKSLKKYKDFLKQNNTLIEKVKNIDSEIALLKKETNEEWQWSVTFEILPKNGEFTFSDLNSINYFSTQKIFIFNPVIEEIESGLFRVGLDTYTRKESLEFIEKLKSKNEYKIFNIKYKE